MATSSLYKTFSLRTREETDAFMQMFEEALRNPSKIEKSGIKLATEEDIEQMINMWQIENEDNSSK